MVLASSKHQNIGNPPTLVLALARKQHCTKSFGIIQRKPCEIHCFGIPKATKAIVKYMVLALTRPQNIVNQLHGFGFHSQLYS